MKFRSFSRRTFLKDSGLATAGLLAAPHAIRAANKATNSLRVGVMGLSRGVAHVRRFAETPNVEVAYVCDVDESRVARGAKALNKGKAKGVGDFRRILGDSFWPTPAAPAPRGG